MRRSRTIVVVDDVPMFRDLTSLFLARTARVLQAGSAEEALSLLRSESVDLLITDLHMPGMDGAELCRTVKADPELSQLPVVMLLRGGSDEDSMRAVRAGADDLLSKPLCRGLLIETVKHYLETGLSRGLPRVEITAPIQLRNELLHTWGTARNISRGGIFVEADCELEPKSEVALELVLPDTTHQITPVAQVVWKREAADHRMIELGMRFLAIDSETMHQLDDFVGQRIPPILPSTASYPI
jgi:CheY-like chemotaxis protein